MTTDSWTRFQPSKLPYEESFKTMEWLSWKPTREGGLLSEQIIAGGRGSASWLVSKLKQLEIEATTVNQKGIGVDISASRVFISPQEVQKFCHLSASPTQDELIKSLKLDCLLGNARSRR